MLAVSARARVLLSSRGAQVPWQPASSSRLAHTGAQYKHYDVAVIGGGVVGLAVARDAAVQGKSVLVLEQAPNISAGASSGNSGLACTGYDAPVGSLERRCIRRAIQRGNVTRRNPSPPRLLCNRAACRAPRWCGVLRFRRLICTAVQPCCCHAKIVWCSAFLAAYVHSAAFVGTGVHSAALAAFVGTGVHSAAFVGTGVQCTDDRTGLTDRDIIKRCPTLPCAALSVMQPPSCTGHSAFVTTTSASVAPWSWHGPRMSTKNLPTCCKRMPMQGIRTRV
jgi:hypothetical protein